MARSGVVYGSSGSRKTAQVKMFSHYIAQTTGKATLLLSLDGGGWDPCQPEVAAKMVLPYRCETATLPLSILRNISRGYWPEDPEQIEPSRINLKPIDWSTIGGIAVEGWTSISQVVMRYLPDSGVSVGGEDRNKLGGFFQEMYVDGRLQRTDLRSNTRGDFGFAQNYLYGLVMNFNSLPCRYVLYTALEAKTEDDDRSTTFGPAISGKKATSQCGAWVGDMIHAQDYAVPRSSDVPDPSKPGEKTTETVFDMTVRMYFRKHLDPSTGIPFPAKARVAPEKMKELEKEFPGGYFEPTPEWGIDRYLAAIDKLHEGQADSLKGWRERVDNKLRGSGGAAVPIPTK